MCDWHTDAVSAERHAHDDVPASPLKLEFSPAKFPRPASRVPLTERVLAFGPFEIHRVQQLLVVDGEPVPLGRRALGILVALIDHVGDMVSNEALIVHVWRGIGGRGGCGSSPVPLTAAIVERASDSLGGYDLRDADARFVAEICGRLAGTGLAIERAADRMDAFGLRGGLPRGSGRRISSA